MLLILFKDNFRMKSLKHLNKYLVAVHPDAKFIGHNQVSTKACPSYDVYKDFITSFPSDQLSKLNLNDNQLDSSDTIQDNLFDFNFTIDGVQIL